MNKTTMAIINFENNQQRYFVDPKKINKATLGDLFECGWSYDDCGLKYEKDNEDGEALYSSCDYEDLKTIEEIEDEKIEIDWFCISYWNGNNWQKDIFETYDEVEVEIEKLDPPSPAYYFSYIITLEDGEKINCSESNMSGSLSPYYVEDEDID